MIVSRRLTIIGIGIGMLIALLVAFAIWSSGARTQYPAPLRVDTTLNRTPNQSTLVTQATASFGAIRAKLEDALPTTLVTIDQREEQCVPRQQVRALGLRLFDTPRLGCDLQGDITRGPIALGGSGQTLRARIPINARIEVRNLGDIIQRETVTAAADVTVEAKLFLGADWALNSDIDLRYVWTREPGFDVLGQRVKLTSVADKGIANSLGDIERKLEAEIRRVDLRREIEAIWREGFDTLSINRDNPPVWMRVTPSELGAGALSVSGSALQAELLLKAELELRVGERPEPSPPKALGANVGVPKERGFEIKVPVIADYAELEPVVLKELRSLSLEDVLGTGGDAITAEFQSVTIYATHEGRLAVGIDARVTPSGIFAGEYWGGTQGQVWLTGEPITQAGSEVLIIKDLAIHGDMDRYSGDLLVRFLNQPVVREQIKSALTTNFREDYETLVAKAEKGLKKVTIGKAQLSFEVDAYTHGRITVTGSGLHLPVIAKGTVATKLAP
ncbi:MAG: DUF4403 family protein [Erythrobacter sp.]|nr:DUF4403 family protein [Erythrobacter sp.]